MEQQSKLCIWSVRKSGARGTYARMEREVTPDSAQGWLDVFVYDEPGVIFVVADNKAAAIALLHAAGGCPPANTGERS